METGGAIVIGIAGGSGSGKTTIVRNLCRQFGENVSVLYQDSYYKAHDELTLDQRKGLNYDHPDAFDTPLLVQDIERLRRGEGVYCPVYDFSDYNRTNRTVWIPPAPVVLIEGLLVLQDPDICRQLDIRVFVDTDADVRILRRIRRDVKERGRSLDSVINQYLRTAKPMHERYVEPSRRNADLIIPEGGHNQVALDMLINRIQTYISGGEHDGETIL